MAKSHRRLTILLPPELGNSQYAAVLMGVQGVLYAARIADRSTMRPDGGISDSELNTYRDAADVHDPWSPT